MAGGRLRRNPVIGRDAEGAAARREGRFAALLPAGLAVLVLALVLVLAGPVRAGEGDMSAPQAFEAARSGRLTIIDVRTVGEWAATGVPQGAARVSLFPEWGVPNKRFVADILEAVGGDKSAPVALICATGRRSAFARALLAENGFTRVYSIAEGMAGSAAGPGWLARGLPVAPCEDC